ncbi:MAG: PepSY-like domain-containing protein [Chitinophagales bacterium]|nr:PepSY-like domain-containing protein [Bacteroidota bacterium]MCB9043706.1 PepSY-like domain-containing protein [Chitinophagales bacterium]
MQQLTFREFLSRNEKERFDEEKIKKPIIDAFYAKYPDGKIDGWVREKQNTFGVFFQQKIWTKYAKFDADAQWLETIIFSISKQLPPLVQEVLDKEYPKGFKLGDFQTIINKDGMRFYEILISLKDRDVELKMDAEGNILNNIKYNKSKGNIEDDDLPHQEDDDLGDEVIDEVDDSTDADDSLYDDDDSLGYDEIDMGDD